MIVIWKDIPGYEGLYQVSNLGDVKSLFRYKKLLKPLKHTEGYHRYCLMNKGKRSYKYAHRIIAECFIENYKNDFIINHINGIKTDNRIENLECISFAENNLHAYKIGLQKSKLGNKNKLSKKVDQFNIKGEYLKTWDAMKDIQRELGISYTHISACCLKKANTAGGFIWKYHK